jgi:hypothetical protein
MRKLLSESNICRVAITLLSLSLFISSGDLFGGITYTKYFVLYATAGLLLSYVIIRMLIKDIKFHINMDMIDLLIVGFLFYCCVRYYDKVNIYYFNARSSLFLFIVILFFISTIQKLIHIIILSLRPLWDA